MHSCTRIGIAAVSLAASALGADRATLTGAVVDPSGQPVEHATVMVYHAGVKKGYSMFCPSCYPDCGKRTQTTKEGQFTFQGLNPDLWFELLVVHDGYTPEFVKHVDPAKGILAKATLKIRRPVEDPARVVRARLVNVHGSPVRDAVVQPLGFEFNQGAMYGTVEGIDPIAVSNANGEFEIARNTPTAWMLLSVEARGLAPKIFNKLPTGNERHTLTLTDGSAVRGRLLQNGKPIGGAEIGLIARNRDLTPNDAQMGNPYQEIRVGTQPDGTFSIVNIPKGVGWYLYGEMESLGSRGASPSVEFATREDGQEIDLGDIPIRPALHLRGRVILADGKPLAEGMRITIQANPLRGHAADTVTALLDTNGRFDLTGLRPDDYDVLASVKGYHFGDRPLGTAEVLVEHDVNDFTITLEPNKK